MAYLTNHYCAEVGYATFILAHVARYGPGAARYVQAKTVGNNREAKGASARLVVITNTRLQPPRLAWRLRSS